MIQKRMLAAACAGLACVFSLFRCRSIFDKERLPLRQVQNYRTFAKIAKNIIKKIFLKKSENTIDKRLAAVYNTVK